MAWTDRCLDVAAALNVSPEIAGRVGRYQALVEAAAMAEGVDLDLVNGTIMVESRFQPRAVSSKGAGGLMQLMPGTYAELAKATGVTGDRFDPATNIRLGTYYLRRLAKRWGDREEWQLASYNAGAGRVAKHGPSVARNYVVAVQRARDNFRDARLRCRGADLPAPQWGAKARPRPTPAPAPQPAPSSGGGGVLVALLVIFALAGERDVRRVVPSWL